MTSRSRSYQDKLNETAAEAEATKGAGKGKRIKAGGKIPESNGHHQYITAPAGTPPLPRNQVVIPLEPQAQVMCKHRDGTFRNVRIVERRLKLDSDEFEYYVHYRKLNRRMDEWVSIDRFDLDTVIAPELLPVGDAKARKRRLEEEHSGEEGEGDISVEELIAHEEFTKVKNVEIIELGKYQMETWYFSPLPDEFKNCRMLYFCEYDLEFFKHRHQMLKHLKKCRIQHPPGTEIYRQNGISMYEVDGKKERIYCENLCYLAKMFLDHKTLKYDCDAFYFYVMCEYDDRGAHITGYFSKEKVSDAGLNLNCILTLPCYQRRGYGKFIISFSYELSRIEGKVGTPERPLSDMGLVSYRGYWSRNILQILKEREGSISLKELSELTMIQTKDIESTLQHLKMIQYRSQQPFIYAPPALIDAQLKACGSPGLLVDPSKIIWTPPDHSERKT